MSGPIINIYINIRFYAYLYIYIYDRPSHHKFDFFSKICPLTFISHPPWCVVGCHLKNSKYCPTLPPTHPPPSMLKRLYICLTLFLPGGWVESTHSFLKVKLLKKSCRKHNIRNPFKFSIFVLVYDPIFVFLTHLSCWPMSI